MNSYHTHAKLWRDKAVMDVFRWCCAYGCVSTFLHCVSHCWSAFEVRLFLFVWFYDFYECICTNSDSREHRNIADWNLSDDVYIIWMCSREQNTYFLVFYVLLIMHLGSVLVNYKLYAQFFFRIYLFQFSTCFEHPCAHHQENQLY